VCVCAYDPCRTTHVSDPAALPRSFPAPDVNTRRQPASHHLLPTARVCRQVNRAQQTGQRSTIAWGPGSIDASRAVEALSSGVQGPSGGVSEFKFSEEQLEVVDAKVGRQLAWWQVATLF
jgi:hypothetical protein